jgi:hypothetical protein
MKLTASLGECIERIEIDLSGDFLDYSEASVSTQVTLAETAGQQGIRIATQSS